MISTLPTLLLLPLGLKHKLVKVNVSTPVTKAGSATSRTSATNFSISIRDIDYPNAVEVAYIDCSTGRWGAYGDLPKATLDLYLDDFCTTSVDTLLPPIGGCFQLV